MLRATRSLCARKSYSRWDFLPRVEDVAREARTDPEPLPPPQFIDVSRCTLEYFDSPPLEEAQRGHEAPVTFVLVHGAPGSYNDFRHLVPLLEKHRVIGINLPGYAGSSVAKEHYLESVSALPTAGLALDAVKKLCGGQEGSDRVFLVGHSFGAHTVVNMAALHAGDRESDVTIRGMALLAPAGCRPHRVLRPRESAMVVDALRRDNAVVNWLVSHLIKAIYTKMLRFPDKLPPEHYLSGLIRAGTTDFNVIRAQVDQLQRLKLPALLAWSENDEFMEHNIPTELATLCHRGPRLAFAGGGHNIQKTRAEQISTAMVEWVERILAEEEEHGQQIQHLP